MSKVLSRRHFLTQASLVAASAALAACAPQATPTAAPPPAQAPKGEPTKSAPPPTAIPATAPTVAKAPEATKAPAPAAPAAGQYKESPALAELVKGGKLPPVDQRLPKTPKVANELPAKFLQPEVGKYGGVFRTVTSVPDWDADVFVMNNEALLNTPGILAEEVTPNIAKEFKVSSDLKEFTLVLREGLKWSDGQPVTMDDVRFAVEDVLLNKELTPAVPVWMKAGNKPTGDPFTFQVLDDWTFKFNFTAPYGGFPVILAIAQWRGYDSFIKPAHYLKQFHKKYTPEDKLKTLAQAEKLETWVQLFSRKDIINTELTKKEAIGFPVLYPWMIKEVTAQTFTYERNPYYFKVDTAGNQLPYVDKIVSTLVTDIETVAMKHISGEVDFARESSTLAKIPLYKENEKRSGYRVVMNRMQVTSCDVNLNLTYSDPVWREVVRNLKFRQALNYGIDRKELLDTIWYGQAQMPTVVPTEFSVEKANKLLDEIGMDKRDGDGFRLGPNGKTFIIPIESGGHNTDMIPVGEMFVQFWTKIGMKTTLKRIDQTLWAQRKAANELQCTTMWHPLHIWFQTFNSWGLGDWGPLWMRWYDTGGKDGEAPTPEAKAVIEKIYASLEVPIAEVPKVLQDLRKLMYDNLFLFYTGENYTHPVIVNAKIANVSESRDCFGIGNNFAAEQFFYKS